MIRLAGHREGTAWVRHFARRNRMVAIANPRMAAE
jgi:hypothetical protein